jgi:hypothetical protein
VLNQTDRTGTQMPSSKIFTPTSATTVGDLLRAEREGFKVPEEFSRIARGASQVFEKMRYAFDLQRPTNSPLPQMPLPPSPLALLRLEAKYFAQEVLRAVQSNGSDNAANGVNHRALVQAIVGNHGPSLGKERPPAVVQKTGSPRPRRVRAVQPPISPLRRQALELLHSVGWKYSSLKWAPIVERMIQRSNEGKIAATWLEERKDIRAWCDEQRSASEAKCIAMDRKNDGQVPATSTLNKRLNLLEGIYHKLA